MANPTDTAPSDADAPLYSSVATNTHLSLSRMSAAQQLKKEADLNFKPPPPVWNKAKKQYVFETLPTLLKRQMASPLKLNGSNPHGPNGERLVTSGWKARRAAKQVDPSSNQALDMSRPHMGLDFAAPGPRGTKAGEDVLAAADGRVTFVGYQPRKSVTLPYATPDGHIYDGVTKAEVAYPNTRTQQGTIGFGGIYIEIEHDGDFHGYTSQYMHLSKATVEVGKNLAGQTGKILAGQKIGEVGTTGGDTGRIKDAGSHLHWQVKYRGKIVKPELMVPFYTPNQSTDKDAGISLQTTVLSSEPNVTGGEQAVFCGGITQIQCHERQTAMSNQTMADHKEMQASYRDLASKKYGLQASTIYEAVAKFKGQIPQVDQPMTFDFDLGEWSDDHEAV